jgi:hypothetical protein
MQLKFSQGINGSFIFATAERSKTSPVDGMRSGHGNRLLAIVPEAIMEIRSSFFQQIVVLILAACLNISLANGVAGVSQATD